MELSGRDSLILYLHYREGWSLRRIAKACCLSHEWVRQELSRILEDIADAIDPDSVDSEPYVEGFFSSWCDSGPRQQPRLVALRQERLAQDLETAMDARAESLDAASECMGARRSRPHKRNKGSDWTQWELCYLNAAGRISIPESVYGAGRQSRTPAYYCASNPDTCGLECYGCSGTP